MTTDHPAVEAVARYLCHCYWDSGERWDEFVEQAHAVVDIVETAQVPQRVVLSAPAGDTELGRTARVWVVGDPEPEDSPLVRDADGDGWVREAEGWITAVGHHPWDTLLRVWGPVTEVREP